MTSTIPVPIVEDDDFIVETSEKEVYRSNGLLVKAWLNADPQNDNSKARVVLNWLENMAKTGKFCRPIMYQKSENSVLPRNQLPFCSK